MTRAVLALGSNLGDREATMAEAVRRLADAPGVELVAVSRFHESVALTPEGPDASAPAYLNAVAIVDTTLGPEELLELANRVEEELGRVRGRRWADRTLDVDIVAFGDVRQASERLTLPHPRAAERDFVLAPWLEVDAAAVLPGHGRVDELLDALR